MTKNLTTVPLLTALAFPAAAQQTMDVHTHIIVPEYVEVLKAHGAELEETFPLPAWDAERHIAFMDIAGIRTAVLTMPAPQPYFSDAEESAACIRRVNEISAEVKRQHPGRFLFCAALPLPDVDAAVREAVYALDTLGADGIKLATNSRGQYLGDEALEPLMKVLNERHAVIIIHPHRPTPYADKILRENAGQLFETEKDAGDDEMLIRISEIEVYPEYLDEYLAFARNVGAESVRKEPGVICIYPMIQKRDSCQIRILEIYAGQEAYKEHIASEHFQTYKQGTLHMVKSLDLVDMTPMNPEGMDEIFRKTNFDNISKKQ